MWLFLFEITNGTIELFCSSRSRTWSTNSVQFRNWKLVLVADKQRNNPWSGLVFLCLLSEKCNIASLFNLTQARPAQSASWAISTQHRSTNYRRQSRDSIPSILNSISMESDNDESEARDPPAPRRGGLLPPIKSTPPEQCINLPGIQNPKLTSSMNRILMGCQLSIKKIKTDTWNWILRCG